MASHNSVSNAPISTATLDSSHLGMSSITTVYLQNPSEDFQAEAPILATAPATSETQEAARPLYTIQGSREEYPVYACSHTQKDEVIIPEALLLEMQQKIEEMGFRGLKLVREKTSAMQAGKIWLKELREMQAREKASKKAQKAAEKRTESLQAELKAAEKAVIAAQAQVFAAQQSSLIPSTRIDSLEAGDRRAEREKFQEANRRLSNERDALQEQLDTSTLANTALQEENSRLANAEADCATFVEQVSELEEQVSALKTENACLRSLGGDAAICKQQQLERWNTILESKMRLYDMEKETSVTEAASTSRLGWASRSVRSLRLSRIFRTDDEGPILPR